MTKKEKILIIAEEEFAKHGYDAVSINDLVKKLDMNKATIYYHYKDKKSLYQTIVKKAITKSNENIKKIFEQEKENKTLLRDYVNAIILTIKENPNIVPIALRELANFGANIDESFIPFVEEEVSALQKVLDGFDLKEEYKNMNIYAFYSFITGTINSFYAIQMSDLPLGNDEELKQNSQKTLDFISQFISNIIIDAIVKTRNQNEI